MASELEGLEESSPGRPCEAEEPVSLHFPVEDGDNNLGNDTCVSRAGSNPASGRPVVSTTSTEGGSCIGSPSPEQVAMPTVEGGTSRELGRALAKQRAKHQVSAQTFESRPQASQADASHLCGIQFNAPKISEWLLRQQEPEEDRSRELLSNGLTERGPLPCHLIQQAALTKQDVRELQVILDGLTKIRVELAAKKAMQEFDVNEIRRREETLKQKEEAVINKGTFKDYPRPAFLTLAKLEGTMNVGVVGNSGVGKSLLINRLRGVPSGGVGWAPVGVVETTKQVSMYAFPNERRVRLWDFPGAGTQLFPLKGYIARFGLRYLDMVIIVTASRYTETEVALMEELRQFNVPRIMVRTKIDIDVQNNATDNGKTDQQTLQSIREELLQHVQVENQAELQRQQLYLVSLRDTEKFDFPNLLQEVFPCFGKATLGTGYDDPWALPEAYSDVVAAIQGTWSDGECTYTVLGTNVHIQHDSESAEVLLCEKDGKAWWQNMLWVDKESAAQARRHPFELRWSPKSLGMTRPVVWKWA